MSPSLKGLNKGSYPLAHDWLAVRTCLDRLIEVYNDRLDRWIVELLDDLSGSVPQALERCVTFNSARKVRRVDIALACLFLIQSNIQHLW